MQKWLGLSQRRQSKRIRSKPGFSVVNVNVGTNCSFFLGWGPRGAGAFVLLYFLNPPNYSTVGGRERSRNNGENVDSEYIPLLAVCNAAS